MKVVITSYETLAFPHYSIGFSVIKMGTEMEKKKTNKQTNPKSIQNRSKIHRWLLVIFFCDAFFFKYEVEKIKQKSCETLHLFR